MVLVQLFCRPGSTRVTCVIEDDFVIAPASTGRICVLPFLEFISFRFRRGSRRRLSLLITMLHAQTKTVGPGRLPRRHFLFVLEVGGVQVPFAVEFYVGYGGECSGGRII